MFVWSGIQLPFKHDDPLKRQLTSSVETFNLLTSSWEKKQTTDIPLNGAIRIAAAVLVMIFIFLVDVVILMSVTIMICMF